MVGACGSSLRLEGTWVLSVQLRSVATTFAQRTRTKDPVSTCAEVRLRDREVGEVGTQTVDCGLDFLEIGGGRGL